MNNFGEWLKEQKDQRGMTQKELADRSGITPAQISRIISGTRGAGESALISIAHALRLPTETVFRAAGLLPKVTQISERREKLHYAIDKVLEEDLDQLYKIIESFTEEDPPPPPQAPTKPVSYPSRKKPARSVLKDK